MNFSVYLDDSTTARLSRLGKRQGKNRNALIRAAIDDLIAREGESRWPDSVLEFEGIPGWPAFEAARDGLPAPADDPLATRAPPAARALKRATKRP